MHKNIPSSINVVDVRSVASRWRVMGALTPDMGGDTVKNAASSVQPWQSNEPQLQTAEPNCAPPRRWRKFWQSRVPVGMRACFCTNRNSSSCSRNHDRRPRRRLALSPVPGTSRRSSTASTSIGDRTDDDIGAGITTLKPAMNSASRGVRVEVDMM